MKKKKTDMGNEYIQVKDICNNSYSVRESVDAGKICICRDFSDAVEIQIKLNRKKSLELAMILAYFGNTGRLPEVYRGKLCEVFTGRSVEAIVPLTKGKKK